MKLTNKELKNWVARDMGYPSWDEFFNWIARADEKPSVIAQQIEAAMQKVCIESVRQTLLYHPKFEDWMIGKYYEDAGGFRDIRENSNDRYTREFVYKCWIES